MPPDDLRAALIASLSARLKRVRSRRRFISYDESGAVASEPDAWLDDVEARLLPADPAAAWKLVERFIRADAYDADRRAGADLRGARGRGRGVCQRSGASTS